MHLMRGSRREQLPCLERNSCLCLGRIQAAGIVLMLIDLIGQAWGTASAGNTCRVPGCRLSRDDTLVTLGP